MPPVVPKILHVGDAQVRDPENLCSWGKLAPFCYACQNGCDLAKGALRPLLGLRAVEDGAEVGGGEGLSGFESGLGGGARPFDGRHLLLEYRRDPLLLVERGEGDLQSA